MTELNNIVLTSSKHTQTDEYLPSSDNEVSAKFHLQPEFKAKLSDLPEVVAFIELLQDYIKKQKIKLNKLRLKLRKQAKLKKKYKDQSIQTSEEPNVYANEVYSPEPKTLADDIKDAAESALRNTGFVYEETSGMYYDYNTGYYYNAEYGLYYDGNTGTYYSYDQDTQTYNFHSQVSTETIPTNENHNSKRKKKKVKKTKELKCTKSGNKPDIEEGECSQSSDTTSVEEEEDNSDEACKSWPPCIRIIVEESEVPKMKIGSLYIITCDGGSIGREGKHSIIIPDINISKHHLKITYDKEASKYMGVDLGSRNGTYLNGKRISSAKKESEPVEILHGSKLKIGSTIFLCHIHDGNQTCGHCEPGLLLQDESTPRMYKINRSDQHKTELKTLRKKFGLGQETEAKLASGYTDRAQKRRETVGSQNPHEKTQVASVSESIPSENKGFKLLSKMGWKEGQSLGKDNDGIVEPITVVANTGVAGIGSEELKNQRTTKPSKKSNKKIILKITQERFQKLPETNDIFRDSDVEEYT